MQLLLSLLIVTSGPEASIGGRPPEATQVFHCAFDDAWDRNYDGWPDRWTRRFGPGFPQYLKVAIDRQQPGPAGGHTLRFDLDGSGAVAYSPPIPARSIYDYVLEGYVQTQGLKHDGAFLSITFLDQGDQRCETYYSDRISGTSGWQRLRLPILSPLAPEIRKAKIGLHLEPGAKADLHGTARFADIWLGRLPRMRLQWTQGQGILEDAAEASAQCVVSGFTGASPIIDLELLDVAGKQVAHVRQKARVEDVPSLDAEDEPGRIGTVAWKPPVPGPGFYRVRAAMLTEQASLYHRDVTLAVLAPLPSLAEGEFGWSLPQGDGPMPLSDLAQLIGRSGVFWVKYPVWCDSTAPDAQIRPMLDFLDRLSSQGVAAVGLLNRLPGGMKCPRSLGDDASVAEVFLTEPEVWSASLQNTIAQCGTLVRWWQLGGDRDTSFMGLPDLQEKIKQIKAELDRVAYDANVGLAWDWLYPLPVASGKAPWRFVTLSAEPPLTAKELTTYFSSLENGEERRWVLLQPLSRDHYTAEDRAVDLVERMVAAKVAGAEAVFVPDPFDADCGLFNPDGTPNEAYLPWRTAAMLLGGTEPMGTLPLASGSPNQLFAKGSEVVMVASSPEPAEDTLYLGENVRQFDLWGRELPVRSGREGQTIALGPQPTFIVGLNKSVAEWRLKCVLVESRVPSVLNSRHKNRFQVHNSFPYEVEGHVRFSGPEGWQIDPQQATFRVGPNGVLEQPLELTLPETVAIGRHVLRAEFEIAADRAYRFEVDRPIGVGLSDVRIEVSTMLNDRGELEVQQRLINENTSPVSFRCHLFTPDRRRKTLDVVNLTQGYDSKTYNLPNGKALIGKTLWLQAEQLDGPRRLNYRFVVE